MKSLNSVLVEHKKEQRKQDKLHKKYKEHDKNIKIVEKRSLLKFILKLVVSMLHKIFLLLVSIFVYIGVVAILYKEPREELMAIFKNTYEHIMAFII